jgi:hypothetical protein
VRLLLDTHTTLWWLDSPEKLGKTGYSLIADPANDIPISPVVPWELAIKANKGKIPLHPLVTDFQKVIQKQEFISIQIPFTLSAPACCPSTIAIHLTVCWPHNRWNSECRSSASMQSSKDTALNASGSADFFACILA